MTESRSVGKVRLLSLDDLDRRSVAYRELKRTRDAVIADLGGPDSLTEAQRQIIDSGSLLAAMLKDLGVRWLLGHPVDPSHAATLSNAMRRMFETAGLRRRTEIKPAELSDLEVARRIAHTLDDIRKTAPSLAMVFEQPARPAAPIEQPQADNETSTPVEPQPEAPPREGDSETIEGIPIFCVQITRDGRDKWVLLDHERRPLEFHFGRDTARNRARALIERLKPQ